MTLEMAVGFLTNKKGKSFHDLDWLYINSLEKLFVFTHLTFLYRLSKFYDLNYSVL